MSFITRLDSRHNSEHEPRTEYTYVLLREFIINPIDYNVLKHEIYNSLFSPPLFYPTSYVEPS